MKQVSISTLRLVLGDSTALGASIIEKAKMRQQNEQHADPVDANSSLLDRVRLNFAKKSFNNGAADGSVMHKV